MNIGIVGAGMVGSTIAHGFKYIGHSVIAHDIRLNTSLRDVLACPLIFVCVPTPRDESGACDTRIVADVIGDLAKYNYNGLSVIKSTVTPGTTDALAMRWPGLRLAFCPEFLREKTAYSDFIDNHEICISGAYKPEDHALIEQAHGRLPKVFAKLKPIDAEFTKYFCNVFNALRIVFANQFYEVCEAAGADYQEIKNAVTKRSNIGPHYLECNKEFRAFGGNCLPKDTAAFAQFIKHFGPKYPTLFEHIVEYNERIKTVDAMPKLRTDAA